MGSWLYFAPLGLVTTLMVSCLAITLLRTARDALGDLLAGSHDQPGRAASLTRRNDP